MRTDLVTRSFELAAERCEDLTPLVYGRLFREHPDLEAFFVMDKTGAARGSMLSWVVNALLDGGGHGHFGHALISTEAINHAGMGVEPAQFALFFPAIVDTLKELLGADWTPAMADAWQSLLAELDQSILHPA